MCGSFDDLDRAALAQELERIEGERAKQRQSIQGVQSENFTPSLSSNELNDEDLIQEGQARDIAARRVGLSPTMYHRAKTIIDKGSDELKQALDLPLGNCADSAPFLLGGKALRKTILSMLGAAALHQDIVNVHSPGGANCCETR